MKQSSIAIIGLSRLFREGLQQLLRRSRFTVTCSAATLREAFEMECPTKPELAMVVLSSSEDASSCIRHIRKVSSDYPGLRVVLLTDPLVEDRLREAAAAGIQAVLSKDITSDVLQRSLELVMLGQQVFPGLPEEPPPPVAAPIPFTRPTLATVAGGDTVPRPDNGAPKGMMHLSVAAAGVDGQRVTHLSERERQILLCLVDGAANKTIARDLNITEATVKVHIKGLLRKIRVNNRTQAAVWGMNNAAKLDTAPPEMIDRGPVLPPLRQVAV